MGVPVPLDEVLERSRRLGFLGPGPIEDQIAHARRFAQAYGSSAPMRALDLGSGGGLPGLVLALEWPSSSWWLLDAGERRAAFLEEAVADLGLNERATVLHGRAEVLGRSVSERHSMDLVTARSFGPPAVTAECAAAFLAIGGLLIVSEPPSDTERWSTEGLEELGLHARDRVAGCQVLSQFELCSDRYPRRVGIPKKRPIF